MVEFIYNLFISQTKSKRLNVLDIRKWSPDCINTRCIVVTGWLNQF